MNLTREQADALPPSHVPSRVRALEAEVQRLQVENDSLRRQLAYRQVPYTAPGISSVPVHHSPPISPESVPSEPGSSIYPSPVHGRRVIRIHETDDFIDSRVSEHSLGFKVLPEFFESILERL
jgi:hypothetical protein